ncbi:MAG TPA: ATP-dependent zinc metalloprotease FtsH [Acetobacteraceae bacterium]|nr:ATP-dependent zinc metalloprotease FtsH [Acetobacteraceae bacterium]
MKREHHFSIWYFVAAFLAIIWLQGWAATQSAVKSIPYSTFQTMLAQGKLADVVVGPQQITGTIKDAKPKEPHRFVTERVPPDLAHELTAAKVTFTGQPGPGLLSSVIGWLLPTAGFFLIWMLLMRRMNGGVGAGMGGGLMGIGRARAKIYVESDVRVTFEDVAGVEEAKDELREIVAFLKDPKGYGRLGAHIPKGILLVGPPGTGKTLLARAVAGEAGVAFFSISGSEFVEMFVGVGAARVRDLFKQAREAAPAIIFIDEIDALGRSRGAGGLGGGGHDEKEQTLNQLLSELDGFDTSIGVVLLAATNRPEVLDPALLRAGRFDRQVLVDRPDKKGRIEILKLHLGKLRLAADVSPEDIAAMTPGFTGADLANLCNEAALLATRRGAEQVAEDDFSQAVERIVAGLEKRNRLMNAHEREVVAHHEMGHAIVAMALPGTDPVQKISIIPRGFAALGYTMQRPTEDRFLMDRGELANRMAVLLGGRAAESLLFPEVSTGASDDLVRATDIARSMVTKFGMDAELGLVAYEPQQPRMLATPEALGFEPRRYAETTASAIDRAVRGLIEQAFDRARAILGDNMDLLRGSAAHLLAQESLTGDELRAIATEVRRPALPASRKAAE